MKLVCVGASAGGLDPLIRCLSGFSGQGHGFAIVVIQHLLRDHKSHMQEILETRISLPVQPVSEELPLAEGVVYLAPPGKSVRIADAKLYLQDLPLDFPNKGIDYFFLSAAKAFGKDCVAFILSGSGQDGTEGCREIFRLGGQVFVQNPEEAEFSAMPESVIRAGYYNKIIPANALAKELANLQHDIDQVSSDEQEYFSQIIAQMPRLQKILAKRHSIQLQYYKHPTLCRRLHKRMLDQKILNLDSYLDYLERTETEQDLLFQDLMVNVTQFFRDPDFFATLGKHLEKSIQSRNEKTEYRVWIAGCSTGQEAYSVAILLEEIFAHLSLSANYRILATDINPENLKIASRGNYSSRLCKDLSAERIDKYFTRQKDNSIEIVEAIRKKIVFSQHDLILSPPFSQIDLVLCRNLLIYLQTQSQGKAITNLVFALVIDGILALGPAETLGVFQRYFSIQDHKWNIFEKKHKHLNLGANLWETPSMRPRTLQEHHKPAEQVVLDARFFSFYERLFPHSLLLDTSSQVLAVYGKAAKLLRHEMNGPMNFSAEKLIDADFGLPIKALMMRVQQEETVVEVVGFRAPQELKDWQLFVRCFLLPKDEKLFVLELRNKKADQTDHGSIQIDVEKASDLLQGLERELKEQARLLQEKNEELEQFREELQTSNEELIASNEELQSTNEELNSVNEELYTLNNELQLKVEQTSSMNSDLNNLIESSEFGVLFLNEQFQLRKMTHNLEELFYVRPTDLGRNVFELDFGRYLSKFQNGMRTDAYFKADQEILGKDGQFYRIDIKPYFDLTKNPCGFVITVINVNDSKKNSLFLEETQADGKIGGWILDTQTGKTNWSRQVYDIYDIPFSSSTDLDQGIASYIGEDQERIRQLVEQAYQGKSFAETLQFRSAAGRFKWVRVTGRPIVDGNAKVVKVRGSIQDITELKFFEERSKHALRSAQAGIWDWDIETGQVFWDEVALQIYAMDRMSSGLGIEDWKLCIHPEDRNSVLAELDASLKGDKDYEARFRIIDHQGVSKNIYCRAQIVRDGTGKPLRLIGAHIDISDIVRKDTELRRQHQIAAQSAKLAQLGELSAGLAHEINNPLAIALGNLEMIESLLQDEPQAARAKLDKYIMNQHLALERIRVLVKELRGFSRQSSDEPSQFALDAAVEETLSLLKALKSQEGIDLQVDLDRNLFVYGDRGRFNQVVTNLLSNAIDALSVKESPRIHLRSEVVKDKIRLIIEDNGPGIPEDLHLRVFDHFFTTKDVNKGTGIGLSLSRSLIEQMDGTLTLDTSYKGGARFVIELPVSPVDLRKDQFSLANLDSASKERLGHKRVLIVMEDALQLDRIKQEFESLGVAVTEAHRPESALLLAGKSHYDAIFSDFQFVDSAGVDLLEDLLENGYDKSHLFLMATAVPAHQRQDLVRCCQEILQKPLSQERIYQALDSLPSSLS